MKAEAWFVAFRKWFSESKSKSVADLYDSGKRVSDSAWTKILKGVLTSMAEDLDYTIQPERSSFGRRRFDMKWQNDENDEIYIEYENDYKGSWAEEIPKLLDSGGSLKVLITYLPLREFPGEKFADKLLELLRNKSGQAYEFLLVFGTQDMNQPSDWVGHALVPTFERHMLVRPSS